MSMEISAQVLGILKNRLSFQEDIIHSALVKFYQLFMD